MYAWKRMRAPVFRVFFLLIRYALYFAGTTRRRRRTHNRCRGRHQNRAAGTASTRLRAAARWAWEIRCSCHQPRLRRRRRRRRHRPRFPPIHRQSAPTWSACPPAKPSCAYSTRNTWRPSGTVSSPDSPSAGRSSCTVGGTVPWTSRTLARHSSDPIYKQVRVCSTSRFVYYMIAMAVVPREVN